MNTIEQNGEVTIINIPNSFIIRLNENTTLKFESVNHTVNVNLHENTSGGDTEQNDANDKKEHKPNTKRLQYRKKYYERNKEQILENARQYYSDNKDKKIEYQKKRMKNEENLNKHREIARRYYHEKKKQKSNINANTDNEHQNDISDD